MSRRATKRALERYRSGAKLLPGDRKRVKRWKRRMYRYARRPGATIGESFAPVFASMSRFVNQCNAALRDLGIRL